MSTLATQRLVANSNELLDSRRMWRPITLDEVKDTGLTIPEIDPKAEPGLTTFYQTNKEDPLSVIMVVRGSNGERIHTLNLKEEALRELEAKKELDWARTHPSGSGEAGRS